MLNYVDIHGRLRAPLSFHFECIEILLITFDIWQGLGNLASMPVSGESINADCTMLT